MLGTRYLAINGATPDQLRPTRRLLILSSLVALALNVADPLIAGQLGQAAFDSVGPLLLIGWAEVGPGLLAALVAIARSDSTIGPNQTAMSVLALSNVTIVTGASLKRALASKVSAGCPQKKNY